MVCDWLGKVEPYRALTHGQAPFYVLQVLTRNATKSRTQLCLWMALAHNACGTWVGGFHSSRCVSRGVQELGIGAVSHTLNLEISAQGQISCSCKQNPPTSTQVESTSHGLPVVLKGQI